MYTVERDWMSKGFRCVVIMDSQMGFRCGYVGVPSGHPLYGVRRNDDAPPQLLKLWESVKEGPIGKRGILDVVCLNLDKPMVGVVFDVHGGITYSGGGGEATYPFLSVYPVISNLWWFGYDCGHAGDGVETSVMQVGLRDIYERYPDRGPVRSVEYCVGECESLATQLAQLDGESGEHSKT